jgi:flagellar biosynthetic protein FlhB
MAEQFGEKTHDATPHRRQKAREEGNVAKSQDLSSALLLLGALLAAWWLSSSVALFFGEFARQQLSGASPVDIDSQWVAAQWQSIIWGLAKSLLPILGLMMVVAIAVNLAQVGFLFVPKKLGLDISRISPLKGFQRMFSLSSVMRLSLGVFKIIVVAAVAAWSLWDERDAILSLTALQVPQIAGFIATIVFFTCLKVAIALVLLAILDFAYQRWKYEQDLKMTDQEMREEMKSLQGDPQVISRRKAVQRQLALNRMSAEVPKADVVVTNPTHFAIAIRYDPETMAAPIVVAKGADSAAGRIRRIALEHGIPIIERKELARSLYNTVDISQPIPVEQYTAVAEVLRYVYELKGKSLPTPQNAA